MDRQEGGPEGSQPGDAGPEDAAAGGLEEGGGGVERRPFGSELQMAPESFRDDDFEDDGPQELRSRYAVCDSRSLCLHLHSSKVLFHLGGYCNHSLRWEGGGGRE